MVEEAKFAARRVRREIERCRQRVTGGELPDLWIRRLGRSARQFEDAAKMLREEQEALRRVRSG